MTYESIIEKVPADKRGVADAFLQGLAEGIGMTIVDASNDKREEDAKPEQNPNASQADRFDFGDPSIWDTPLYEH